MIRLIALLLMATPLAAETVVAARTIQAQSMILPEDVLIRDQFIPGSIANPADVIGMEARIALYAGRPIRPGDIGFPAVVERNQIIPLHYHRQGLIISTEGRALGRAGPGDMIRVMNLSSRTTVTAQIGADGAGYVAQ
ncbi:flagellar basal body P-ring formation chaperone FlgA [Yoonia sp.]|uniref:flagellar basal body P-ring formation chaperone FlgA n=1 Tax=Yoonia sp. TaxID=2212373 RepID=UPI0019FB56AD|nr:flagellar basal body P-ring formation chaperone FlgA [Yoonia sp.]MBE0413783.1 flagellar basal body P-ring formation protein FlgA [Yoonia sp.]